VNQNPDWASCQNATAGLSLSITLDLQTDDKLSGLKLQRRIDTLPQIISTRLPDKFMALQSQLSATEEQKKNAFIRFMENETQNPESSRRYVGFVTKESAPIYLISKEAFPFKKYEDKEVKRSSPWISYYYIPEPMWHEEEIKETHDDEANVDVPVDEGFFNSLFGSKLVKNVNNVQSEVSTVAALSNTRLVCCYFSAHWCGPCRQFTPMLVEMYDHLKNVYPSHGLEIVFVSKDRDEPSFRNYFSSMPWLSVPFSSDAGEALRRRISERFVVQGIPAFIVLDSMSGNIVIPKEQSRTDIMNACRGGDHAIEQLFENNWLQKVPIESKNMMDILKLSFAEDMNTTMDCDEEKNNGSNPYLEREADESMTEQKPMSKDEQTACIKKYFSQLVEDGMAPNEAAVKAINMVAELARAKDEGKCSADLLPGTLKGTKSTGQSQTLSAKILDDVLSTAKKYIENVNKHPSSPKFRQFKLSNKFSDRITSSGGGIDCLVNQLGFRIYSNDIDFIASIPLSIDISALTKRIDELLGENE